MSFFFAAASTVVRPLNQGQTSVESRNSFLFNGSSESIDCGNDASLQLTSAISASVWVKLNSKTGAFALSKWNSSGSQRSWAIEYRSADDAFSFKHSVNGSSTVNVIGITNPSLVDWYNITGVYDGTNSKIYVNGVEEASTPLGNLFNSSAQVLVGAANAGSTALWDGSITQPIIIDRALTDPEIIEIYNAGVVLDYPLISTTITDDCAMCLAMSNTDSSLNDLSTNTNNGTATGGVTFDGDLIDWEFLP